MTIAPEMSIQSLAVAQTPNTSEEKKSSVDETKLGKKTSRAIKVLSMNRINLLLNLNKFTEIKMILFFSLDLIYVMLC